MPILNRPGRPVDQVGSDIRADLAEIESYGQMVLSTPDFADRLRHVTVMNAPDRTPYYGGGATGYTGPRSDTPEAVGPMACRA